MVPAISSANATDPEIVVVDSNSFDAPEVLVVVVVVVVVLVVAVVESGTFPATECISKSPRQV